QVPLEQSFQDAYPSLRERFPDFFAHKPGDAGNWHERQASECETAQEWPAALFHLQRLAVLQPQRSDLFDRRGRTFLMLNQPKQAGLEFDKAIKRRNDSPDHFFHRARAAIMLGDWTKAISDLDQAAELAPRNGACELARFLVNEHQGKHAL